MIPYLSTPEPGNERHVIVQDSNFNAMYDNIKNAVQEYGEVMIRTDSGEEHELHLHNAEFLEAPLVKVDADDEVIWLDLSKVERYWIHEDF